MNTGLSVDVLSPGGLSASERAVWRGFTAASPRLASPFFSLDFALAADGVAPGAAVAVVHEAGRIQAFLPFQRRGTVIQPLGAPLSDYHGLIAGPGCRVELDAVVRLLGAGAYRFNGLVASAIAPGARCVAHTPMVADVSGGLEAYLQARPKTRKFFKEKARRAAALAEAAGELEFRFEDGAEAFDFVLGHKRAQYRQSKRHDIFACGWTEQLLRRLWEVRTPDFGGRFTTLRAGDRLVSAEFGLRGGAVHHLWFPAYDPEFARFGAGTTLTIETIKSAAEHPQVRSVDFGPGGGEGDYKPTYADPVGVVYEGAVTAGVLPAAASRLASAALSAEPLAQIRDRLRRRFAIIDACETKAAGWVGGAVTAFRDAATGRAAA